MKVKEIVDCYKTLGEAKVTKLSEADVVKIVKARKTLRPHAEDFEAFLKDCQEKFKPTDFDKVQEKAQKWDSLTNEEKIEVNKVLIDYQKKLNDAILDEQEKEIEVTLEKLEDGAGSKLIQENSWEVKKLEDIDVML